MIRMLHVLRAPRGRRLWLIRSDSRPDKLFRSAQAALRQAAWDCQHLADTSRHAVALREWDARDRPEDRVFEPAVASAPARLRYAR